jgi:hypothetical protein
MLPLHIYEKTKTFNYEKTKTFNYEKTKTSLKNILTSTCKIP